MKRYLAEIIGTFTLVFIGCGSAVGINNILSSAGYGIPLVFSSLAIAFSFGLSVVAMAYTIGPISGCHVNPAISLAMWVTKKMNTKDFIFYVLSQIIGSFIATGCLAFIFNSTSNLGANGYGEFSFLNCTMLSAIIIEIVLTFIFVLTVLNVSSNSNYSKIGGLIIGLTLTLVHIFGIPFTGTSVNPARSLAPAVITGGKVFSQVWLFILAPLAGAIIASFVYKIFEKDFIKE